MNEEQELRDRLAAVDVPPSRIELDALVRAGRRRAFRRRSVQGVGGVALATALLLAVPSILTRAGAQPAAGLADASADPTATVEATASAEPTASPAATAPDGRCTMMELPVPGGMRDVTADAVDPAGRYVVGNSVVGQDFRPVLWTDGQPQALPVPGQSVQVTAVNSGGIAVGLVENGPQEEYVFRYEKGGYTRLRTPPGNWHVYPSPAINAAGDVVINAEPRGNSGGKDSIVLLWKAGSTTAVKLRLPDGANAYDITDDGTIVGAMYRNGVGIAAYAWDQQGKGRKLRAPAGETGAAYAAAGDWATGGLWPSRSTAVWNIRTGEVTDLATEGPGQSVNAAGWVVTNGVLVRDGAAVDLSVPSGQAGFASAVSDTGLVVGQARSSDSNDHQNLGPRVWRC
ncbi:hypothetical protein Q2K19_17275 [Micromonospora soli]|uniref:hypothetical protein n=1 Tax=Micromonospora sp. NBRC 110009 TaxID=3061627 RepID=UPI0026731E11|nr:hypothetical protein [Micromonospora sp. NBRC 110009]WKT96001.1 hypothetical protein Q2K19_17275 [Micromonospora sp. NBRC 110009]